jgi:hypothetical protein
MRWSALDGILGFVAAGLYGILFDSFEAANEPAVGWLPV